MRVAVYLLFLLFLLCGCRAVAPHPPLNDRHRLRISERVYESHTEYGLFRMVRGSTNPGPAWHVQWFDPSGRLLKEGGVGGTEWSYRVPFTVVQIRGDDALGEARFGVGVVSEGKIDPSLLAMPGWEDSTEQTQYVSVQPVIWRDEHDQHRLVNDVLEYRCGLEVNSLDSTLRSPTLMELLHAPFEPDDTVERLAVRHGWRSVNEDGIFIIDRNVLPQRPGMRDTGHHPLLRVRWFDQKGQLLRTGYCVSRQTYGLEAVVTVTRIEATNMPERFTYALGIWKPPTAEIRERRTLNDRMAWPPRGLPDRTPQMPLVQLFVIDWQAGPTDALGTAYGWTGKFGAQFDVRSLDGDFELAGWSYDGIARPRRDR